MNKEIVWSRMNLKEVTSKQRKVRVIHSPEEFGKFKSGEILVAPTTDPMWSTLFPVAKAVVTEMGGILSHAAIVAREYGTPCVVNVRGIIDVLQDGDLIEVNGKSGTVEIIEEDLKAYEFKK